MSEQTHPALRGLRDEEKAELRDLVHKKAWVMSSRVAPFTQRENAKIRRVEKNRGKDAARLVQRRIYDRHHWDSLRWFLFGGYADLPVASDPDRPWDPERNPWLKVHVPGWAFTQDEHDEAEPFKRLPDKDYLRALAYTWVFEPRLLIPKSRQLLVTWLFCCIAAHETLFRRARRTAFISKKFDDADALLDRIEIVTERLPSHKFWVPEVKRKEGELSVPHASSVVQAMGEEAKGLRQYTFSWIFSDEMGFQEQAGDAVQAALPTLKDDRMTGVSTANGKETFYFMSSDNGTIPVPAGR